MNLNHRLRNFGRVRSPSNLFPNRTPPILSMHRNETSGQKHKD